MVVYKVIMFLRIYSDIYPERDLKTTVEVVPQRRGHKQITATLECDQLHNIKGVTEVYIR